MTKAIVIYQSLFGNTKKIAMSLARGLEESGVITDCLHIDEVDIEKLVEYDFIAIGGPTHILGMSKQMKAFIGKLKTANLRGKMGFSFDTRILSKMNKRSLFFLENSAARRIEGKMKHRKIKMVRSRESALVTGREGPLNQQAESRFFQIGKEIGAILLPKLPQVA
ncbi:MAG: flavodoxin family protein [Candidatus Thorarchaeota archaeon]